jgi:glycosyltransferase involved in cell wall biosynthesis
MMRVLHIDAGKPYGGIETMLVTLARHRRLCPLMEPEFAVCFEDRLSHELAAIGVPVHVLGPVRFRRPLTIWRARKGLEDLLRRRRFDAIVCHGSAQQATFGPVVRAAGAPAVFWMHTLATGHWLDRWARLTPPDFAICNSDFTRQTLADIFPRVPADVVYCPVAPEGGLSECQRITLRDELGTPHDATVIIQVGRMEPLKGHRVHLEALAMLRDVPNWMCWQVGGAQRGREREYVEELKASAKKLGVAQKVRFLGQRRDCPALLRAADIYCQPNTEGDSFGIAFVEALYAGLPVVTSAIGGAVEIVNESCGFLAPPGDAKALSEILRRLMQDAALRERLGLAGPARAASICEPARLIPRLHQVVGDAVRYKVRHAGQGAREMNAADTPAL